MLLPADRITVGSVESVAHCDVTLQTAGLEAPITIDREADRYLARSKSTFRVDGEVVTSKLLLPGNTIQLGNRGRLRFQKPAPASATACLRPTAAPFAHGDIRCVVLMRESLLFGPPGTHFRIPNCRNSLVLFHADESFSLRELPPNGNFVGLQQEATSLPLNKPIAFCDVRFVLRRFADHTEETQHGHI